LPDTVAQGLDVLARKLGGNVGNPMASEADVLAAIAALTEASAAKFNKQNPDAKGVYYQSWAGVASNSGHLGDGDATKVGKLADPQGDPHQVGNIGNQSILQASTYLSRSQANGKLNDGVVPVQSAEWGNYRGAVPADHNHLTHQGSAADQQRTGFDVVDFYREMGEDLAKRGY
jgi:triacylglycerol esterase/lipase EstA (alpha/beta hydrolase family)